jgi:hypothetical protein
MCVDETIYWVFADVPISRIFTVVRRRLHLAEMAGLGRVSDLVNPELQRLGWIVDPR